MQREGDAKSPSPTLCTPLPLQRGPPERGDAHPPERGMQRVGEGGRDGAWERPLLVTAGTILSRYSLA
jgi:hypothetical protein